MPPARRPFLSNKPHRNRQFQPKAPVKVKEPERVASIYDSIQDGNEYGSIVSLLPRDGLDLFDDFVKGLSVIEGLRGRPCLGYVANVVKNPAGSGIDATDDLPFLEMVSKVPAGVAEVDFYLVTNGGSAQQVSRFVNALRQRFEKVHFLLPSFCMSAGTLFALSGDSIWMSARACLGPIDPQVPSKDGRFVPAQALLLLVKELQQQGDKAIAAGQGVPWSAVRIIDSMDKKELGDAITASQYSMMLATQFLLNYKFKTWTHHLKAGAPVTPDEKQATAEFVADALASHDRWKAHGHSIAREVLWQEVRLLIDHPGPDLEKAMIKLWALCYYLFDKTAGLKAMVSQQYRYARNAAQPKAATS